MSAGAAVLTGQPDAPPLRGLPQRYRVLRRLGAGSQKQVYLAHDERAGADVVVARLDANAIERSSLDAFHEIAALARVGAHPNIVGVEQVVEADSEVYLIQPLMAGGDVEALLAAAPERRLSIARALELGMQLCRALDHAHQHGVVHGDVKPGNLLLDAEGTLHLGDFGLARIAASRGPDRLAGTLAYLSPEQIRGEPSGPASDLYALGCVLYELLTGAPPFSAATPAELVSLHQLGRTRDVQSRRPSVPVSLSLLVAKLLEKDPAARPSSAAEVRAALEGVLRAHVALGAEHGAQRWGAMVGREAELEAIAGAAADARQGRPRVLLLSGETGIGKTQLLVHAAAATGAGSLVLYGLCGDDRALPHRPVVDALLPLAAHLSELPSEHAERLREFLYLVPGSPLRAAPAERGVNQQRLFVSILSALTSFSQGRPIVLVLEDLHQADSASIELFQYLVSAVGDRSERDPLELLLIGSLREPGSERLSRLVALVDQLPHCERLELLPLSEAATTELLRERGVANPSRQLVEQLSRASHGNPLLMHEILRELQASGELEEQGGAIVARGSLETLGLPGTVVEAVSQRVAELGPQALQTLRLAALLGAEFEMRSLAELSASPLSGLLAGVDEALASGLLDDEGGRLRFVHPLMREVMAASLAEPERRQLHRWLADYWMATRDRDPRRRDLEIARHLMQSGPLASPIEVGRYAGRAAEHALAKFAWAEGADFLQAALDAIRASESSPRNDLLRAELHRKAGFAYFRRLDPGPCLHHYGEAALLFQARGDRQRHAQTLNDRIRALVWFGMNDLAGPADAGPLRTALDELGDEPRQLRAEILSTLAEHAWSQSDAPTAERFAMAAMELTRPEQDHLLRAEISINLGLSQHHALRPEEALATWRLGALHARRAGDLSATARCLQRAHMALLCLGRLDESLRAGEEVAAMNRVLQLPGEAAITSGVRASVAAVRVDPDAVEKHAGIALDLVRRAKYPWAMMFAAPVLACSRALRGDAAGAHRAVDLLTDPKLSFVDAGHFAALAHSYRWLIDHYVGDPVRIAVGEREMLAQAVEQASDDGIGLTTACLAVEVAEAVQDARIASLAWPLVERAEALGGVFTVGWPFFLPRLLGAAAGLAGAWDVAERGLAEAIELAERLGARAELGRSRLALAQLLALRNEANDPERARQLVRAATADLEACSAIAFVARAAKLRAYLDR